MKRTLDDLFHAAMIYGETVEIVLCEEYGYTFKIGNEFLTPPENEGMPHETFSYKLEKFSTSEKLKEMLDEFEESQKVQQSE